MKLSIVVSTYNRENLLVKCLDSLIDQTAEHSFYEVIIINNNSTDKTQTVINDYLSRGGNFRTFFEERPGVSNARNLGWQKAEGDYVAFIDDDAMAEKTWVEKLLQSFLNIKPEPVAVGGRIFPYYIEEKPVSFNEKREIRSWGNDSQFLTARNARFGFSGSNMAFQKKILSEFGGFSTRYGPKGNKFSLGEEPELFSRIYTKYRNFWYDPSIIVYHYVNPIQYKNLYRIKRKIFLNIWTSARLRLDQLKYYLQN